MRSRRSMTQGHKGTMLQGSATSCQDSSWHGEAIVQDINPVSNRSTRSLENAQSNTQQTCLSINFNMSVKTWYIISADPGEPRGARLRSNAKWARKRVRRRMKNEATFWRLVSYRCRKRREASESDVRHRYPCIERFRS